MDDRANFWQHAYAGALSGLLSAETETFRLSDPLRVVTRASLYADLSTIEYTKRFCQGKDQAKQ
jgi:hypothetical protein